MGTEAGYKGQTVIGPKISKYEFRDLSTVEKKTGQRVRSPDRNGCIKRQNAKYGKQGLNPKNDLRSP